MTDILDTDPETLAFLEAFADAAGGDPACQVSMFDMGAAAGLDKAGARRAAELLMGAGLVEIRTLSGGIALTPDGADQLLRRFGGDGPEPVRLGDGPLIDPQVQEHIRRLIDTLRSELPPAAAESPAGREILADLNSATEQLASPRPKTAVVRECFRSAAAALDTAGAADLAQQVNHFLGSAQDG